MNYENLDLSLDKEILAKIYSPEFESNLRYAYSLYVLSKEQLSSLGLNPFEVKRTPLYRRWRMTARMLEHNAGDLGFGGRYTGLVSEKALELMIERTVMKQSWSNNERLATEHPIPNSCIVHYLLAELEQVLTYEEYYAMFHNYSITVVTTNSENQYLKNNGQKTFKFGDSWEDMYNSNGVVTLMKPSLHSAVNKEIWTNWYNNRKSNNV